MKLKRNTRLYCRGFPHQDIWVIRAAKDGTWVDVYVWDALSGASWSKRMPLPLGDMWYADSEQ
jgi:hypothetical protein